MPTATENAEAGPSNHRATAPRRRLCFRSPADDDQGESSGLASASSTVKLPRAKPNVRFPWPPKGRLTSPHVNGDTIVSEHEPLTSNFLREYANGVRDERRKIQQRELDLQERFKTALLRAKRAAVLCAVSMKKTTRFMGQLTELMAAPQPGPEPEQQPEEARDEDEQGDEGRGSPGGENKENEWGPDGDDEDSDDNESGDEGYVPSSTLRVDEFS
ncbi:hypothetical protein BKA70DRAFT_1283727 [Coprinopsis sp. MPI-PUGE-AT-0042]|nr:hypothetical protein BKA70DRAFT_1283727 [Coprinopsis sp. MPI-PUGE-AT-0042]